MITCLIFALALVEPGHAGERYQSSLGYSAVVPSGWTPLTQEGMRREPNRFGRLFHEMATTDPKLASSLRSEVRSGKLDMLFHNEAGSVDFVDNISIRRQPVEEVAWSKEAVAEVCGRLMNPTGEIPKVEGLEECAYQEATGHPALFTRIRGSETITLGYQIVISPTEMLVVTAGAKLKNAKDVGDVLTTLIRSFEFSQ